MSKQFWPALLIVLLGAHPALAQVKLEWRFKEGETFFSERIYTQKQSVEINGKAFKELRSKTWLSAIAVKEKTKAGYLLEFKVESASFQSDGERRGGSQPISLFPSALPADHWAAKIKGCTFKITVTPQGKVSKFEGYEAFIQKLADKNTDSEKALRALITEEGVREDAEEIFSFLPEKIVRKGDKWKRETSEPMPPFGSFKSTYEYVLETDTGPEVAIGLATKTTYRTPSSEVELFKVVKGSLKGDEGKGNLVFDNEAGRLVSSHKSVLVRGELLLESMGRQTKIEFTSDNELRVRVFTK
jgi:Family of unknown function (DUF6263)